MVLLDAILEKAYRVVHWPPGPRQGWATGFDSSPRADNTSVRAGGVLPVGIPRFLNKSQHFTVHLFRPWRPGSARGSDGAPRRFTEVVPTPHAYSSQWPVRTKRARARSCASVVTLKRPSLNRAIPGMVQILGYSGNSTDRPHASTVGIRSVVGPIAGSGTLEAVPAQPVEPVRVRLASQELSGELSHSLQALAPLQRPVMEAECGPDQGS